MFIKVRAEPFITWPNPSMLNAEAAVPVSFAVTSHQRLRERVQYAAQTPHDHSDSDAIVHLFKRDVIITNNHRVAKEVDSLQAGEISKATAIAPSSLHDKCRTDLHNEVDR